MPYSASYHYLFLKFKQKPAELAGLFINQELSFSENFTRDLNSVVSVAKRRQKHIIFSQKRHSFCRQRR